MVTIWFEIKGLRPDFARFTDVQQAENAIVNLIHTRSAGRGLRIRVRVKDRTVYRYERA